MGAYKQINKFAPKNSLIHLLINRKSFLHEWSEGSYPHKLKLQLMGILKKKKEWDGDVLLWFVFTYGRHIATPNHHYKKGKDMRPKPEPLAMDEHPF